MNAQERPARKNQLNQERFLVHAAQMRSVKWRTPLLICAKGEEQLNTLYGSS